MDEFRVRTRSDDSSLHSVRGFLKISWQLRWEVIYLIYMKSKSNYIYEVYTTSPHLLPLKRIDNSLLLSSDFVFLTIY